jgi:paired amphipathic helix protein Sin3a
LALTEKVFENDIDPAVYEEQARFWFGTSAYVMYTVDRLFQHLGKQLSHIVTEPSCVKMFSLYLKEKENPANNRREAQYRRKADEIVDEEENLYKIEFVCLLEYQISIFQSIIRLDVQPRSIDD